MNSRSHILISIGALLALAGCGTTRSTDTTRTATEQLLVSDAIDRSVQNINFGPLAGQSVYLDDSRLSDVVDRNYLVSTLRQHLLASGCMLRDKRDDADFIVEARAGAVGTDRNDLLFGIPATNVPQVVPLQGVPAAIPEVPLAKRRDQRGIAKISMFAYQRSTGLPVWQSGLALRESSSNDVWLFGAGPFQHGTIYDGPTVAGRPHDPRLKKVDATKSDHAKIDLADQATFASPAQLVEKAHRLPPPNEVAPASHDVTPAVATATPTDKPAPALNTVAAAKTDPQSSAAEQPGQPQSSQNAANSGSKKFIPLLTGKIHALQPQKTAQTDTSKDASGTTLPQPRFDSVQ